jgi:hypothetical protein
MEIAPIYYPHIVAVFLRYFRIINSEFLTWNVKMPKRKKTVKKANNPLDRFSTKRRRGRPVKVVASAVRGRADNYRVWLARLWKELGDPLLAAQSEQDVINAFMVALPGNTEFHPYAVLILKVLKDQKFPRRQKARINFLADSIAGLGMVTPRRSRDICAAHRAADKERHQILRYEYWIKCSCTYEGVSENHACKDCGAIVYISQF